MLERGDDGYNVLPGSPVFPWYLKRTKCNFDVSSFHAPACSDDSPICQISSYLKDARCF